MPRSALERVDPGASGACRASPQRLPGRHGEPDVDFYAEHGYLALHQVTTEDELEWRTEVYDILITQPRSGFPDAVFDHCRRAA